MSTRVKTWRYGETRRGEVMFNFRYRVSRKLKAQLVKDDHGEGHILAGGSGDDTAQIGDAGTLTFTKGGPTGGFWKFVKDSEPKPNQL